jgi:hypothetical protein
MFQPNRGDILRWWLYKNAVNKNRGVADGRCPMQEIVACGRSGNIKGQANIKVASVGKRDWAPGEGRISILAGGGEPHSTGSHLDWIDHAGAGLLPGTLTDQVIGSIGTKIVREDGRRTHTHRCDQQSSAEAEKFFRRDE